MLSGRNFQTSVPVPMATQLELSDFIGISTKQIRNLQNKGILPPKLADGTFDGPKTVQAYIDYRVRISRKNGAEKSELGEKKTTYEEEKIRLTKAQADKVEIEVQKELRQLIPAEEVATYFEETGMRLRSKLMTLPTKLSPRLLSQDEIAVIEDILAVEIKDALSELSNDFSL